jgi:hypothetical protein
MDSLLDYAEIKAVIVAQNQKNKKSFGLLLRSYEYFVVDHDTTEIKFPHPFGRDFVFVAIPRKDYNAIISESF